MSNHYIEPHCHDDHQILVPSPLTRGNMEHLIEEELQLTRGRSGVGMEGRNRRKKWAAVSGVCILMFVICLAISILRVKKHHHTSHTKLLLISLDGFHYRYLSDFPNETRFLREYFAENGAFAEKGLQSVFATKTFAIHWTMATGLYEESHGIMSNGFYDPVFNETFSCANDREAKWFGGEPVWSVAQKQGRRVAVSGWMGGEVQFPDDRLSPDFMDPHVNCSVTPVPMRDKLNLVHEFLFEKNADFAMLYYDEPDNTGHWYGAASDKVGQVIAEIDSALRDFMSKVDQATINVIILSDHGMVNVTRHVFLDHKLPPGETIDQLIDYADDNGVIMHFWPKAGQTGNLYSKLDSIKGDDFDVYLREDIPDQWHYKHHLRNAPLLLIAKEGVHVYQKQPEKAEVRADHGYDNELDSMRPFFVARGPAFRPKSRITDASAGLISIYSLCCHLLNVTPNPNNGTVEAFRPVLTQDP